MVLAIYNFGAKKFLEDIGISIEEVTYISHEDGNIIVDAIGCFGSFRTKITFSQFQKIHKITYMEEFI